ncbi:YwqI/YxiC family protein [Bacillus sp. CECT 9360]|uniref:YwqI/YxiC family protein n=1 Tax=Bacillus sp. CECT 9360 TaxID=2845821 RepID=UPI001E56B3AA|nr:YwqI/YxiC family protein [Bacillus sp. CECT 9360]CAH0345749.1 hypothetical protein BCI9360_02047 [Bacillus sp. CECT 9360]
METIKLRYDTVMKSLDQVQHALDSVNIPGPSSGALGQNKLEFTDKWLDREANIQKMVKQYMDVVYKNLEDTRANVELLKDQDEAMVKK